MTGSKNILIAGLGAILIGGAGFFGGMPYQKNVTPANFNRQIGNRDGVASGANGAGGQRVGGGMGFRPVVGSIISRDDKSITVKLPDGSSKIVMLSATTQTNKADKVDATSLTVGATVRVFGTTNADGSVIAQDIQLNPEQVQNQ
ncbi:hypothetical protein COT50_00765 [candidate division WWE3 bacterium CG08_land_8_20_14_0_20_41_10]|uniref:DUF5666 domain-containing protein n=1 Tax=candidate division WWE3 bacterium CG08_land_8_20_14_0_20_41_10 TaxID=1975085 RepID=A0A2H0XCH7_UNCKA|nr:MAG: hypothetical protein COT50_00765 [candidate division WWE3 bacterium CG08_land_8_20_14_0_20_41_10]